jgi:SpoVK/Ycf46/Vps4 family AAA+-type ATPase
VAVDPGVLSALEAVVAAEPANYAVRMHLAGLLVQAGQPGRALAHLEPVLLAEPTNVGALALAAQAAEAVGDKARADAWRRVAGALTGTPTGQPMPPPPSPGSAPLGTTADGASPPGQVASDGSADDAGPVPDDVGEKGPDWDEALERLVKEDRAHRVMLADVGGLDDVKRRLEESFLGPLRAPELRRLYGASLRGGLLLWGPPGCGKTFLARAVAGELGAHFFSVGLQDVLDMWLGNSEKNLHQLFDRARRRGPSVLFFDELDAIGHNRAGPGRGAMRNVVAQLLTELDGVAYENEGLFVIGASNQPWDVDAALRRPGRFDHSVLVVPPDGPARSAILHYHLKGRPVDLPDLGRVVAATEGFSGADLRLVCEDGARAALAEAVRTGISRPITETDLLASARALKPSTLAWFDIARNFATYSNTNGEYDELAAYLRNKGKGRSGR